MLWARRRGWKLRIAGLVLITAIGHGEARAAPRSREVTESGWSEIGSFQGTGGTGWLSRLNDWLFEYERDDELFQDLGDVGLGLGLDIGTVEVDWDSFFRSRAVRAHEELPPGATVTDSHLSTYRSLTQARTRLRLSWDYFRELIGEIDVGVEAEGGYSLAFARARTPRLASDRAFEPYTRDKAGAELRRFFREQELSAKSDLIDLAFGSTAAVVDKVAGELGERLADTEKAATFYDAYADSLTLLTSSHLPPQPLLFTSEDSPLAVGDAMTFTTFLGFSPLRAAFDEGGVRASFKRFRRWIRETTVRKEPDGSALVRIRTLRRDGNELIPFKVRPEVRMLFVITLGYTFMELRREAFDEVVSDVTYRIDLRNAAAREFFETLVKEATRAKRIPRPPARLEQAGVETLSSEYRTGKTRDRRMRVRLFSWLRFNESHVTSVQRVQLEDAELLEVIRARLQELRKPFGHKRRYKVRSIITMQSDLTWRQGVSGVDIHPGEQVAATIETRFSAPIARGSDLRTLGQNLETIVGLDESTPELKPLRDPPEDETRGLVFNLVLSFGPQQLRRLEAVTEDQLWIVLAELLLGPDFRGAWSTADQRFWWRPTERSHGRALQGNPHVSQEYDRLRGFRRGRTTALGFAPEARPSRELFMMAAKTIKKFKGIQKEIREGDCLRCLTEVLSKASDVVLLQALLVRFAGGVESGDVGFVAEVFSDDMAAPARVGNDVTYTYRHRRGPEVLQDVELLRDAEPRLRGGVVLLNTSRGSDPPTGSAEDPCWKLRLYSDLLFEPQMPLRTYLREVQLETDREIQIATLDLGEPLPVPQDPFMIARYYYDVRLPWSGLLETGRAYTLLMRVLNSEGLPVSEEQEIRLALPEGWQERVPTRCLPRLDIPAHGLFGAAPALAPVVQAGESSAGSASSADCGR